MSYSGEKEVFLSATYIFCITPSERNDLVKLYHISPQKIMVLGRPVSADFLYPSHDEFGMPYRFLVNQTNISTKSQIKLEYSLSCNKTSDKWWTKKAFLYCGRVAGPLCGSCFGITNACYHAQLLTRVLYFQLRSILPAE